MMTIHRYSTNAYRGSSLIAYADEQSVCTDLTNGGIHILFQETATNRTGEDKPTGRCLHLRIPPCHLAALRNVLDQADARPSA